MPTWLGHNAKERNVSRYRCYKSKIATSLGFVLASVGLSTTPVHAGLDQLWFLAEDSKFQPLDYVNPDGLISVNGDLPKNSNIVNMKDYNCVDASGESAANGTPLIIYSCKGGSNPGDWNQRWRSNPDPNQGWNLPGSFQYGNWTYYAGTGKSYVPPQIFPFFGTWGSIAVGDNWGACVDVPGGNDANGQSLQMYECNGTPAQVWRGGIPSFGESPFWIRSNITGQGVNRCWTNWGRVVLYDCAYDF